MNAGWDKDNNNETDIDLHYDPDNANGGGQCMVTPFGDDIEKGFNAGFERNISKDYDAYNSSQVEYGLNVPIKYEYDNDYDSSTSSNDSDEIRENELGYFMGNSQDSQSQQDENVLDNFNRSKTVKIHNLSDLEDDTDATSDEAPEPEIVNLNGKRYGDDNDDIIPTKVKKGGEYNFGIKRKY